MIFVNSSNMHEICDNIINIEQYFEIWLDQLHGFLHKYTREGHLRKHLSIINYL